MECFLPLQYSYDILGLCRVSLDTVLPISVTRWFTTFKFQSPAHQQCTQPSTSISTHLIIGVRPNGRRKRKKPDGFAFMSRVEWRSFASHQLDVLSYPKSLLSYHSYTLGILMMALLFAVISGNSMTYLPGS